MEVKASFAARFWSTVLAMLYHSSGFALEGLPLDMVATAFWILGIQASSELNYDSFWVRITGLGYQVLELVDIIVKGPVFLVVGG